MIKLSHLQPAILFLLSILVLSGCVDQDFDEPPIPDVPTLESNTTIAELKALHTLGDPDQEISEDIIIEGVVVADDESGNFFKNIVIQDPTGGITVRMNTNGLFNNFPIGRQVFVRCQGLYLGDFNGIIQLNGSPGEAIEELLIGDHVIGGLRDQQVTPKAVTIDDLGPADINTLVTITDVQFISADTGQTYANAVDRQSINRTLEDCNERQIILRSSGFADFASQRTPAGRGSITAVYSVFGDTDQLFIRDLEDIAFDQVRCDGTPPPPDTTDNAQAEPISVQEVRDLFNQGTTTIPANRKISAVVISDAANENTDFRNIVVQEGEAGIVVRFEDGHNFALGDEVEVLVGGRELSEFRGLLQIADVPNSAATRLGEGALPTPRATSISELLANAEAWESTLVSMKTVTIKGGTTFGGDRTATDSTGEMSMFTRSQATFANFPIPSDPLDVVAIVSQFNDPQLVLRNLDDLSGGEGGGDPGSGGGGGSDTNSVTEDFETQINNVSITLDGWLNVALKGDRNWLAKSFGDNFYAQATAFQDSNPEMEAWLITPPLDLSAGLVLRFESAQAFYVHDGLSVWISTDFDGDDVAAATWQPLAATLAGANSNSNEWIPSGDIDLAGFSGTGYIGFKYEGNPNDGTTSYRLDNIQIEAD